MNYEFFVEFYEEYEAEILEAKEYVEAWLLNLV